MQKLLNLIFLLLAVEAAAQTEKPITLELKDKALNEVLHMLRNQYAFQLSFTENEVAKYRVTVAKTFPTKQETLEYLLRGLPFKLKATAGVFIIIPLKPGAAQPRDELHLSGQIVEAGSWEPLSYSNIIINRKQLVADVTGSFNYIASADSSFHVQISHLGYFILDTVMNAGENRRFMLKPAALPLQEIKVRNRLVDKSTLIGEFAASMKLNHNIAQYLPGQGDNSIFNLLRLMPGVQAANEQSSDVQLSGSPEGQNLITFDGFTLFGLKNYNNNISIVNPFLVKNIDIYQGGFQAKYGNRVGGLVQITGKNGSLLKPTFSFNINATTLNGMAEIPLFKKSSLILAYRQTYYNLYNSGDFNIYAPTRPRAESGTDPATVKSEDYGISVYPDDYRYRDFNLKYSLKLKETDQLALSIYLGGDKYKLVTSKQITNNENQEQDPFQVDMSDREKNSQSGASVFYNKRWNERLSSNLTFSFSDYSREAVQQFQGRPGDTTQEDTFDETEFSNTTNELSIRNENQLNLKNGHQLEFGVGAYFNQASLTNLNQYGETQDLNKEQDFENTHYYAYVLDQLPIGKRLNLNTGLRLNLANSGRKALAEPRLSLQYKLTESLKLNAAWGRYHQYMYKLAYVDRNNNYTYFWVTGDNQTPVLNATHYFTGLNYYKNTFTFNVEAYLKHTNNLTREVAGQSQQTPGSPTESYAYSSYAGEAKSYGINSFIRKDIGRQTIWLSYNLGKSLERLAKAGEILPDWQAAMNDQRHEFKLAGIFNYRRFFLSANYVYGSGMELLKQAFPNGGTPTDYQRVDVALIYKLKWKKTDSEFGVSILNIFDRENLSYNNLRSINLSPEYSSVKFYTNAVPLTPTVFFKIVF